MQEAACDIVELLISIDWIRMLDAETKDYLDEKIDTFAEMVQGGFNDMGERIDRVEKKVDHLEVKVDNLDVKVDKLEVKFDKLETKVDNLEIKVDQLDVKVDQLEVKVEERFDYLDGFVKRLDRNDLEIAAAHGGLQRHEERIIRLEEKNA